MKEIFLSWGMMLISILFNIFGMMVVKMKMNTLGAIKLDSLRSVLEYVVLLLKSPLVSGGVFLFLIAPFFFAVALSRMAISTAYPVYVGLNFFLSIVLAYFVLGEQMAGVKLIGIALIAVGIIMIYLKG